MYIPCTYSEYTLYVCMHIHVDVAKGATQNCTDISYNYQLLHETKTELRLSVAYKW